MLRPIRESIGITAGGGEFSMAVRRDLLRYARRSSHVCLAQFPSDTPALRRLGLWVHHREPDDSRRTLPSAKRKLVDGTCFLRLEIGDAGRPRRHFDGQSVHPVAGNPFSGLTRFLKSSYPLGISSFVVLLATITTFLYLEQVRLVASFFLIVWLRFAY